MDGEVGQPGQVGRAEIVVVGSINVDRRVVVRSLPRAGETVLADSTAQLSGGKGANQAVAAARLGRRTTLVGAVGDDPQGGWLRDRLAEAGVATDHLTTVPGDSGLALVLVDGSGENSIVVAPGANARLTAEHVAAAAPVLAEAAAVLVQCEVPVAAIAEAARLARGLVLLNPAPASPLPDHLWARVDVVVPNRGELAQLTGLGPEVDLVTMARALPCDRVVVTLGGEGALVVDGGLVETVPAPVVEVVDTTGAGDCFCAALADALVGGSTLVEATRRAVAAAALSVQQVGAQPR
ncbi:ribokinase [Nocardioides mangrovi]|uniref:Ribokinase n=1 Tax=Nocardioides mangrovi TaxID=2874580 RepID=A0ABS7UGR4_9ACTN|nr:ribokinase [Nocardioides mangrovi]MBZ5739813.1 ribokinase [Nocardioides mangrovi]